MLSDSLAHSAAPTSWVETEVVNVWWQPEWPALKATVGKHIPCLINESGFDLARGVLGGALSREPTSAPCPLGAP